jgi:hypothetical protein
MAAYLFLIFAVLTRVLPHPDWLNFTAVGAMLIYFGARRSWREIAAPLAALIAVDYCLTVFVYHYSFHPQAYLLTWAWYAMAFALGRILLHARTSFLRVAASVFLGPTSFFVLSNFAVWVMDSTGITYARSLGGLVTCYVAALPFYRNDLLSTGFFLALAFGIPALVRRTAEARALGDRIPAPVRVPIRTPRA